MLLLKVNIRGEVFKDAVSVHPVSKNRPCIRKKTLYIGWVKARFSFHNIPVVMVVIRRYGELPFMLITDLEVNNEADALHILEIYLTRWKWEESWRFIKQSYNLEDIRLMKYVGLRNTVTLLTAVFFFISVILGAVMKLWIL